MAQDFKRLCEIIVAKNGNISTQDVFSCGFTMEHFIKIAQPKINTEKLVNGAKALLDKMNEEDQKEMKA